MGLALNGKSKATGEIMQCPTCEEELQVRSYSDLRLDYCGTCGGVWCDRGELQPVVRALIKAKKISDATPAAIPAQRRQTDLDDSTKDCPRCEQETESFNFAYDSNIFLNRCLSCEGIWLDGGELREVAQFLQKSAFDGV